MNRDRLPSPYPTPRTPEDWTELTAPIFDLSNPGEGQSFDNAVCREYSDGTTFMTWNQPGQTVELAPVPREGTSIGLCTAESEYGMTMPDIFNVNGGDQRSATAIETSLGSLLILQDGMLYALKGGKLVSERDLSEYFTVEHPVIGETWVMSRRDGGKPLQLKDIRSIDVEITSGLELYSGTRHIFPPFQSRDVSTGQSAIKRYSMALRQYEADRPK